MKTITKIMVFCLVAAAVPSPAFAFFGLIDRMTTFNEDQARPFDRTPPDPSPAAPLLYNTNEAADWSYYYTRGDLEAVDALEGSASKVMRPRAPVAEFDGDVIYARQGADPRLSAIVIGPDGRPVLGPNGRPLTGYDLIAYRDAMNRMGDNPNRRLMIGEADGMGLDGTLDPNFKVGVATRVDNPRLSWKDGRGDYTNPRPGDFDYVAPQSHGDYVGDGGQVIAGGQYHPGGTQIGVGGNAATQHMVRPGENLSGISSQKQIYGDWQLWPLIYDANRNVIKDPDLIYPKQNLGIPRDYSVDQAKDARVRAKAKKPPYLPSDGQ